MEKCNDVMRKTDSMGRYAAIYMHSQNALLPYHHTPYSGTQDFMVSYSNAEMSRTLVTEKGLTSYTMKTYPIGHTVNMDELNDLMTFLQTVLPPDDQTYVKVKDPADMSVKELKAAIRKAGLESQARGLMEKSDFVKLLVQHQNKS